MQSSSPVLLFGSADFTKRVREDILAYCESQKYQMTLSDAEIQHLTWNIGNIYQSPEAGKNTHLDFSQLPFELKRSLVRCYSFELLLRGGEADYLEFVQAQDGVYKLTFEEFELLSAEAKNLDNDSRAAIRASCFLVGSNDLRVICRANVTEDVRRALRKHRLPEVISNEGEEFISQFAVMAGLIPDLSPITRLLTKEQNALLIKAFWPNLHMRWLYGSEGADNMTQTLAHGVRENQFNREVDFPVWVWRWRLNIAGFQGGPGAKFYDHKSHTLIERMLTELRRIFDDSNALSHRTYLIENFRATNLPSDDLNVDEMVFMGHLIAFIDYFHRVDIFTATNAASLLKGYVNYKESYSQQTLASNYAKACKNQDAITPTYVPGVLDTALGLLKSHFDAKSQGVATDLQPSLPDKLEIVQTFKTYPENTPKAIECAVEFMCQLSDVLYSTALNQRISCMKLAKVEHLKPVLEEWIKHHASVRFVLSQGVDGAELNTEYATVTLGMRLTS